MTKVIAVFNHKGGVSKTTTTFNLGWMLAKKGYKVLMIDADPQCNLTGVTLGLVHSWPPQDADEPVEQLSSEEASKRDADDEQNFAEIEERTRGFFEHNVERTLYGALKPAFESEPKLLEAVDCFPVEGREGLYLLPGHLRLGEYEVSLGVAQELSGSLLALKNVPGAINYLTRLTAKSYDADFVLFDMSPSLGALNQNIVSTSDLLFIPTSPDFFSIMALQSLAGIIPRWNRWALQARSNEILRTATYAFPEPKLKLAGAVVQRYRLYRAPTEENPYGDPTKPFQEWIERVSSAVSSDLFPALKKAGLTFDESVYQEVGVEDFVLGKVQEFNSLLPKSQEFRVPVYELTPAQLGWVGNVLEGSMRRIASLERVFEDMASKLVALANHC